MHYIRENPQANKELIVTGIALGLEFLHSKHHRISLSNHNKDVAIDHEQKIIHGDVKGVSDMIRTGTTGAYLAWKANVLIDRRGHPQLIDFGISRMIAEA